MILAMECGGDCSLPLLSFLLFETLGRETGTGTLSSEDIFLLSRGAHPIPSKGGQGRRAIVFSVPRPPSALAVSGWHQSPLASLHPWIAVPPCCQIREGLAPYLPWTRLSLLTSTAERLGLD